MCHHKSTHSTFSMGFFLIFLLGLLSAQQPPAHPPPPPQPPSGVGGYPSKLPPTPDIPDAYGIQNRIEEHQIVEAPTRAVTIAELEATLAANRDSSDAKCASVLSGLLLTERASAIRLARWDKEFAGSKTREALMSLADASAFRPLPAEDVPAAAAPSLDEQRQMMARIGNYLSKVIPSLPNLIATRSTTYLEDHPAENTLPSSDAAKTPAAFSWPLHVVGRSKIQVSNIDGKESTVKGALEPANYASRLTTAGEFGPILYGVVMDAAQNNLAWAGWEPGNDGPLAVFRFDASKQKSHYSLRQPNSTKARNELVAYQGEIAILPSDGAIVRLVVEASPYPFDDLASADVMVEYGPVEIGDRTYQCPVHGVALSRIALPAKKGAEKAGTDLLQTQLNDVVFDQYHVFRVESRVVKGFTAEVSQPASPVEPAPPKPGADRPAPSVAEDKSPAWTDAVAEITAPAPNVAVASASAPAGPQTVRPSQQPQATDQTIAPAADVPPQVSPTGSREKTPVMDSSLRMNVDLVLVPVVVRDAKGNVVGNLTREDLQVFDDKKQQEITSFAVETQSGSPSGSAAETRPDGTMKMEPQASPAAPLVVYLFDDIHLKSADLLPLRDAALRNMDTLQPNDLAALISISGQVVLSFTADRKQLRDALMKLHAAPLSGATLAECPDIGYAMALQILREDQSGDTVTAAIQETADCKPGLRNMMSAQPSMGYKVALDMVRLAAQRAQRTGEQETHTAITRTREVIDWLAKMPGKKSVILVSPGFLLEPDMQSDVANVIEKAIRADVAISAINARGLGGMNPGRDIQKAVTHDFQFAQVMSHMDSEEAIEIPHVIEELADGTGGEFITNTGDFVWAFQKLLSPPEFTYVLGFKPAKRDGKFHELSVKLAVKQGLSVQSRQGYFAEK
jgi:VWFA-related protein